MELWLETEKKKQATKKRIVQAQAAGEVDPLYIKHRWPWEEQQVHTKAQFPGRGIDLIFWNSNKVGKPYAQILVKNLEFNEETLPIRLILYPARRTIDEVSHTLEISR